MFLNDFKIFLLLIIMIWDAIARLKNGQTAGPDKIPSEYESQDQLDPLMS